MLILSRKEGDKIYLEVPSDVHDKKIVVTVVEVRGSVVRLGIESDRSVIVDIDK